MEPSQPASASAKEEERGNGKVQAKMADLALGAGKDLFKIGMAIMDKVNTFHENKEECQELHRIVATAMHTMSRLEKTGLMRRLSHPAMSDFPAILDDGLQTVNKWQKRGHVHRLLRSGDMAKQLRRVRDKIQCQVQLVDNALITEFTIIQWTRTIAVRYEGAHPPPTQPQDAAAEMEAYSAHSTAGYVEYHDDIMVTTGTEEAPFAPSSSVSFSETVTTHHVSEESVNGGSSYTIVHKQKIVLKVCMPCEKSRTKALQLISKAGGVSSISIYDKDQLEVVGDGVDTICLVQALRKKIGDAWITKVEKVKDKKPDKRKPDKPKILPGESSSPVSFSATYYQCQEHDDTSVRRAKASGDPIEKPDLLLPEHQPETPLLATAPVRRRRRTFNMSRVHRTVRLPAARHSQLMQRTKPAALSSERWGARVLHQLLVPCALCALLLLASVWALR